MAAWSRNSPGPPRRVLLRSTLANGLIARPSPWSPRCARRAARPATWSGYYIASREMTPEALAKAVRAHWAVENQLHWMLDVNFSEDACMVKKDNAPKILSLIRRVVLNMISLDTTQPAFAKKKLSKRQKRKFANPPRLTSLHALPARLRPADQGRCDPPPSDAVHHGTAQSVPRRSV